MHQKNGMIEFEKSTCMQLHAGRGMAVGQNHIDNKTLA